MIDDEIGFRIKRLRMQFRMSQKQFIDGFNMTHQNLSSIEAGKSGLTIDLFHKIIKKYNVRPMWLLEGTGEMLQHPGSRPNEIPENEKNELYERLLADKNKIIIELTKSRDQYEMLYNLYLDKLGKALDKK
jgi:transcriptional regulator with XRE-family HTH domain